jgi:ABC-type antimicrobial peptide transport system permease subunit
MQKDFAQVEKAAAILAMGGAQFYIPGKNIGEEKRFKEEGGLVWSEAGIFEILDFKWLDGNAVSLKDPNTAVIAESVANKFFGDHKNAIGRTIQLYSFRIPLQIVGVFKDLPGNTDIPIRIAASYPTLRGRLPEVFANNENSWTFTFGQCFVLLKEDQSGDQLQAQFPAFMKRYYPEDKPQDKYNIRLGLQPLEKMHFDSDVELFRFDGLSKKELLSLSLIGLFLILVACINFINLSTAQSVNRGKEIGVRKVLGGSRSQLVKQFYLKLLLLL